MENKTLLNLASKILMNQEKQEEVNLLINYMRDNHLISCLESERYRQNINCNILKINLIKKLCVLKIKRIAESPEKLFFSHECKQILEFVTLLNKCNDNMSQLFSNKEIKIDYNNIAMNLRCEMCKFTTKAENIMNEFCKINNNYDLFNVTSFFGICQNKTLQQCIQDCLTITELNILNDYLRSKGVDAIKF